MRMNMMSKFLLILNKHRRKENAVDWSQANPNVFFLFLKYIYPNFVSSLLCEITLFAAVVVVVGVRVAIGAVVIAYNFFSLCDR